MTPSEWTRIRDLFERALDVNPDDATAWLNQQTGIDAALRAEVISLLLHHARASGFLVAPPAVPTDAFDDPPLPPGQILGPYTIVREAGRGGMGRVYVATDARLGRSVALKAVRRGFTDPVQRERLRHEARAAAQLTHPGICTVFALEELDGNLFIASEFIQGRTLRGEMSGGARPSAGESIAVARAIAEALAAAHRTGIVHGDLKPENVMRADDGRIKILDFGLAGVDAMALASGSAADLHPGHIAGTPGYMAPEQLNGRARDARTDVFAYGVLLYEYVAGVHPFAAASPREMVARILASDARPLAEVRPDLPAALRAVIERCLRKAATDRFSGAAEIAGALTDDSNTVARDKALAWWRAHQLIVMALYAVGAIAAWQIKEAYSDKAYSSVATLVFLTVGIAATVATVFRAHLLFTERLNGVSLPGERRRADPVTLGFDLLICAALTFDGAVMASTAPLSAVLTVALGLGLALARLVLEPSTSRAAFHAE